MCDGNSVDFQPQNVEAEMDAFCAVVFRAHSIWNWAKGKIETWREKKIVVVIS